MYTSSYVPAAQAFSCIHPGLTGLPGIEGRKSNDQREPDIPARQ
jgi:hypothetical protein